MGERQHERRRFRAAMVAVVTVATVVAGCSDEARPAASTSSSSSTASPQPSPAPQPDTAVPVPPPAAPPGGLTADFQQFASGLGADVGVLVGAVGGGSPPLALGEWTHGPAWSTIKVPLSIAGLRMSPSTGVTDAMKAAITQSDNAAADQVWQSLGPPDVAAKAVEAVLSDAGAPATVPAQRPRPEFSAFGQTDWSLADQVKFLSWARCDSANAPVLSLMGEVEGDQRWGLGDMQNALIKGGWGPATDGKYLVRQIAVINTPAGQTAVAMAAVPASGSFADGTGVLTKLAA